MLVLPQPGDGRSVKRATTFVFPEPVEAQARAYQLEQLMHAASAGDAVKLACG